IDFVLELVDARVPASSRFDVTRQLLGDKPRILVFTKTDLAMPDRTQAWARHYRQEGLAVVTLNAQTGQGMSTLQQVMQVESDKVSGKMIARGRLPRASRVMVVGLPNVGKSSLINKLARKKTVGVGDKPGVTRNVRWIRLGKSVELMDTPGIIPPRFEDQELALKLALVGSVSTESYDPILVAPAAIEMLTAYAPQTLEKFEEKTIEGIGKARGFLRPGGEVDMERTVRTFLRDMRTGALGPLTLDLPPGEFDPLAAEEVALDEAPDA
ncbi:MAG: ribosome biogenesis GTPase YlqF, partial [Candidatus Sericytochromatia bacterium]